MRIFLCGYLFVWLQHLVSKEEFLFINSPRGFWRSLEQRSHFCALLAFIGFNLVSFLSNHYQHPLNPLRCLSTKLSHQFSHFIRPKDFKDTTWWLRNTKLLSWRFYLMNMLLILLTLIAIFLIDSTFEKVFDSQCNNEDDFRNDLRGMQWGKEQLLSNPANFYMNPQKSKIDRSAFKWFSVPILNDLPASTTSSFLSQLTVVPTSSFSHFHVPSNATSTANGLRIHNDVTIAHVSARTATTTATKTLAPATRSATTNAPKSQLNKCKATQTQNKARSLNILHPAKKAANYATSRNLLLFFVQSNPVITISSLLLPHNFTRPAITTATNDDFSLQLIVESFSTGAEQAASTTICDDTSKLIVIYSKTSLHFCKDCENFVRENWSNCSNSTETMSLSS